MTGFRRSADALQRGALVALVVGGLVLGASAPTATVTPLGSKAGASCNCTEPPRPRPATNSASGSTLTGSGIITLGAKRGVASGTNHIGEEIPQVA